MSEQLGLKREYFRNSITKQKREELFRIKRTAKPIHPEDPQLLEMNELYQKDLNIEQLLQLVQQLYSEYLLFPDRKLKIITQLKIITVKMVIYDKRSMDPLFEIVKGTFLNDLIGFCDLAYSEDNTLVELTNYSLWIIINLTLADECVSYLMRHFHHLLQLFKSKFEIIVVRILELLHNMLLEPQAFEQIINDFEFEKAILYRLERKNPESILNSVGLCINDMCYNYVMQANQEYLPKILMYMHYCLNENAIYGLIDIIGQDIAVQFIEEYKALVVKLISHPLESINFLNHISSMNDQVLDAILQFPILEELMYIKNSKVQIKVYTTLANFATFIPSHERLAPIFTDFQNLYTNSDLGLQRELIHLLTNYILECQAYEYGKLLRFGAVDILITAMRDIYDPNLIIKCLHSLESLFLFDEAKRRFLLLNGPRVLELLNQNEKIIKLILLLRNNDISNIRVECLGYISAQQFLKGLQFDQNIDVEDMGIFIYIFRITNRSSQWILRKRVKDFVNLEKEVRHDPFIFLKQKEISKETNTDDPEAVKQILFNYLKQLLNSEDFNGPSVSLLRFLEISDVNYGDLRKYKECWLKKRAGGRFSENRCARCGTLWGRWSKRFFCITNHGVMYCKRPTGHEAIIRETLPFDFSFKILSGKQETGHERGIILQFSTRHLVLNAPDMFTFVDFLTAIKQATDDSPYMQLHRFDSFAPIRQSQCTWYVDGKDYFSDAMEAILKAKKTVYITDWWLSPDMYLRRPIYQDEENFTNEASRLDRILKNVADRGVSVLILVYQEPTLALNNDSLHTKTHLEAQSRNIQVMRHPSQTIPFQWSHHEKMIVIDHEVAFMGGLDLCFGRMDTPEHNLQDSSDLVQFWPGIDYVNNRKRDFVNVKYTDKSLINRKETVRMPWHDIAIQIVGESVSDLARHFVQYWNHVIIEQNFESRKKKQVLQGVGQNQVIESNQAGHYQKYIQQLVQESEEDISKISDNRRVSIIYKDQTMNKETLNIIKGIKIVPQQGLQQQQQQQQQQQLQNRHKKITHENQNHTFLQFNESEGVGGSCETQLLRSASNWSIGCSLENTEFSIHLAYAQLIGEAKHFIYIENQFFISCAADPIVQNTVAKALVSRIKQASMKGERFKVIIFVPLLPGFEGEIDSGNSAVLKIQLHWEYYTISRGGNSIIEMLRQDLHIRDPSDYVEFYSLRTHTKLNGIGQTEQIYIHSKLMIVDDEIVLMGSANINDRSLLGNRDSEIAIVVQDKQKIPSIMNGQKMVRSKFAQTLRVNLFMEHLGMNYDEVIDPLSLELQEQMRQRAHNNTLLYRQIFACYPDDTVLTLLQYQQFKITGDITTYDSLSPMIKGHVVEFPLDFLSKENLRIGMLNKEYFVPDDNFT